MVSVNLGTGGPIAQSQTPPKECRIAPRQMRALAATRSLCGVPPGPAVKGAKERGRLGEPEQERDLGHREASLSQVADGESAPGDLEHCGERGALVGQPALQGARAHRELLADVADRGLPRGQELE